MIYGHTVAAGFRLNFRGAATYYIIIAMGKLVGWVTWMMATPRQNKSTKTSTGFTHQNDTEIDSSPSNLFN